MRKLLLLPKNPIVILEELLQAKELVCTSILEANQFG